MSANRRSVLLSVLRGFLLAAVLTLAGMLIIAAIAVFIRIPDNFLTVLNQLLKIASILLGTLSAVGIGGSRGFATGAVLALLYSILGYALYVLFGGGLYSTVQMLGEILLSCMIGAIGGAILANLSPRKRRTNRS